MNAYDFKLTRNTGEEFPLKQLKGKVILVVNTATRCGLTGQYTELEEIYEKYRDRGFEILDFPSSEPLQLNQRL